MKSLSAQLLVALATTLPLAAQPGTMATFDGIDDHLVIADGPYRHNVTLEFWVKPASFNQTLAIRTNAVGFEAGQWSNLLGIRSDGRLEYKILDDMTGGIEWNYSVVTLTGSTVLTVGQWVHVAAVAENGSPGTMRLYVNGVLDASSSAFHRSWTGGDRWLIGTTTTSGLPKLAGSVDEIRLWSEVRSQAQIQNAYAVPMATPLPGGLIAAVNFDAAHNAALMNGVVLEASTVPIAHSHRITGISPTSGVVGSTVTISGAGFGTNAADHQVWFGGVAGQVTAASSTELTVSVPLGAGFGPVTVTRSGRSVVSRQAFGVVYDADPLGAASFPSYPTTSQFVKLETGNRIRWAGQLVDLDGDGKPDLVHGYQSSPGGVSVYRNRHAGGAFSAADLAPRQDFPTSGSPRNVQVGDLDGDGKPDVVAYNSGGNTLSVMRNTSSTGSISFDTHTIATNYSGSMEPRETALGDVDGDGRMDILTVGYNNAEFGIRLSVFRNTSVPGQMAFTETRIPIDASVTNLAAADMDGDGKADVVFTLTGGTMADQRMQVYRSTSTPGAITFAASPAYQVSTNTPYSIAVGDLNGDDLPEIVLSMSNASYLNVFPNTSVSGSISFGTRLQPEAKEGGPGADLRIEDLDGDGKPEVVMAGLTGVASHVIVLPNASTGGVVSLGTKLTYTFQEGALAYQVYGMAVGDADRDAKPDLVLMHYSGVAFLGNRTVTPLAELGQTDFGFGAVGAGVSRTVAVGNPGGLPLVITSIGSSNPDFGISPTSATIPAGGSQDLTITVASGTEVTKTGVITLVHNAPNPVSTDTLTIRFIQMPLAAPEMGTVSALSQTSFSFSWSAVAYATGYLVDLSTSADFGTYVAGYENLPVAGTSIEFTGLAEGTTYHLRVRTVDPDGGSGTNSTTVVATTTTYFAGGDGTAGNPYLVADAVGLDHVRANVNAHYRQTADITLTGTWSPIGGFSGRYDGDGHAIYGLVTTGTNSYRALFASINTANGLLRDLRLVDVSIQGGDRSAGAVGMLTTGARVSNVTVSGSVSSNNVYIGGLVGEVHSGARIDSSISHATVSGQQVVGGMAGYSEGTITRSFATGSVTASSNYSGGVVGQIGNGVVEEVYATGAVSANSGAGGLVGYAFFGTLRKAYASNTVTGSNNADALVGTRYLATISDLYWNTGTGRATSATPGATGLTAEQMLDATSFPAFDFATVWQIESVGAVSMPYLRGQPQDPRPGYRTTPAQVVALAPADEAVRVGIRPTLTWEPALLASTYELVLSTQADFASGNQTFSNLATTSYSVAASLTLDQTYYWRVRGRNTTAAEYGPWSEVRSFAASQPRVSAPGAALTFASNNYVNVAYNAALNPLNAFSVELWAKPTGGTALRMAVSSRAASISGYQILITDTGNWQAMLGASGGWVVLNGPVAEIGAWAHVALTYGDGTARLYVDGMEVASTSLTHTRNLSGAFRIGAIATGTQFPFIGLMDEVRVWNTTRSAQQIRQRMHVPVVGTETGLVGAWNFDEGTDPIAYDATAGARHGTRTGTSYATGDLPPGGAFLEGTGDAWYFLANPAPGVTLAEFLEPLWTQGATGSDSPEAGAPNVYRLDETQWSYVPVTDLTVEATPGKGYLVRVYKNDVYQVEGAFPKRLQVARGAIPARMQAAATHTPGSIHSGFNLVGNPMPHAIDWGHAGWNFSNVSPTVYVYDHTQNNYRTWNRTLGAGTNNGSRSLAPMQGFLIQTTGASAEWSVPAEAVSADDTALLKPVADASAPVPRVALALTRGDRTEETTVFFHLAEGAPAPRHPTLQLEPMEADKLLLYSVDAAGNRVDMAEYPADPGTHADIPIGLDVRDAGSLTIRLQADHLPETWQVVLTDRLTGTRTDLLEHPTYAFEHRGLSKAAADSGTAIRRPALTATVSEPPRFTLSVGPAVPAAGPQDIPTFALAQNYPNPFNPSTVIGYQLSEAGSARLVVYDILGREVAVLVDGVRPAGRHQATFDASTLASGIYLYRLEAGGMVSTRSMVLMK